MLLDDVVETSQLLPISFFEWRGLYNHADVSLVYKMRSIVSQLQRLNGFRVILTGARETFNCSLCGTALEGLTIFSELERCVRSCTDILNCSQKDLQLSIFPSNVGTSNLGSLSPLLSEVGVEASEMPDAEDNNFFTTINL